jgi:hypothetical protein
VGFSDSYFNIANDKTNFAFMISKASLMTKEFLKTANEQSCSSTTPDIMDRDARIIYP